MKEVLSKFKASKFGQFVLKYHLIYLILPFCLWGIKALLYQIAIWSNPTPVYFHFAIDNYIPFVKYFFVFYFVYYYLPQFALWFLSFFDKKKYWICMISLCICTIICFIFYMTFNVAMVREPGYPNGIKLKDVKDISTFFDFCINWIYKKDPIPLNCFPSLHAIVGMMLALIGIYIPKLDSKEMPISFRIIIVICGVGCVLSTIFIKQHYFIDMIVGALLAIVTFFSVWLIIILIKNQKKKTNSCNEFIEDV